MGHQPSANVETITPQQAERMLAGIWWCLSHADTKDANLFLNQLETGAGLLEGNPILVLRDELFTLRRDHSLGTNLSRRRTILLTFKAWNKWRKGKNVKQLRAGMTEQLPDLV